MMVGYDPQSYYESSIDPIWKTSMQEKFNSLQENETWELVPLPSKRKLVQCKWVYRKKISTDGPNINHKAIFFPYNSLNSKEWTIQRHLHRLQRWTPSD